MIIIINIIIIDRSAIDRSPVGEVKGAVVGKIAAAAHRGQLLPARRSAGHVQHVVEAYQIARRLRCRALQLPPEQHRAFRNQIAIESKTEINLEKNITSKIKWYVLRKKKYKIKLLITR